jgi:hypothetical protein
MWQAKRMRQDHPPVMAVVTIPWTRNGMKNVDECRYSRTISTGRIQSYADILSLEMRLAISLEPRN